MRHVVDVAVDPDRARVHEEGWQSWSPSLTYALHDTPLRPRADAARVMNYRPDVRPAASGFWGEGLLAVDPGDGSGVHVVAAPPGADPVPSVSAQVRGSVVSVHADGEVEHTVDSTSPGVPAALARWADDHARRLGTGPLREAPTMWCSWYHYFTQVTEADVDENLAAIVDLDLPVEVVQVDDGYQAEIGDWLTESGRFRSLRDTVARIRATGRRAGIWVAPFLVAPRSRLAADHPDWLVGEATAGANWGQELRVLDTTHPGAEAYLREVFSGLRAMGIDFFKIDFVYAGAVPGVRRDSEVSAQQAYRDGLRVVRESIGDESYLLGCGAPVLPSVGLVDAMRVSPDIGPAWAPDDGEPFGPGQASATANGRARAWQHGRFWVNDSDCLVARPVVERREEWAEHVERYGGLRASSDRLRELDAWGLATTRRLLRRVPATPFAD